MNNKKWKLFLLRDIFSLSRGERLKKYDRKPGDILLKTAGEKNNGFKEKIFSNKTFFKGNCLTIDMFGNVFFEKKGFFADDNVHILSNPNLNPLIGLFLVSILKINVKNYSYSRQVRITRLNQEKIYLPIDDNGNPNWDFMENYIKEKTKNIIFTKKTKKIDYFIKLTNKKCKLFNINDLFNIKGSGKSISRYDNFNKGDYYFISTKGSLNGLQAKSDYYTCQGNVITIDSATIGIAFYQEKKFIASDHVEVLSPNFSNFNKWNALYIVTILNQSMSSIYNYSRKRSQTRIQNEKIFLPIDNNGKPDWKFMEDYIKERAKNIIF